MLIVPHFKMKFFCGVSMAAVIVSRPSIAQNGPRRAKSGLRAFCLDWAASRGHLGTEISNPALYTQRVPLGAGQRCLLATSSVPLSCFTRLVATFTGQCLPIATSPWPLSWFCGTRQHQTSPGEATAGCVRSWFRRTDGAFVSGK